MSLLPLQCLAVLSSALQLLQLQLAQHVDTASSAQVLRMTEGMEDFSAGPVPPSGSASPTGSTVDTGQVPEEKPEETEAAGESGEEGAEGTAEGGGDGDGEHMGALGIVAFPGTCCVCIE
ncbi:hypothetical protein INR49_023461, partial [Caranx melampygus]